MKRTGAGVRMLCVLVIFSIFVATLWDFTRQLQGALTRQTYETLSHVSEDYNKAFLDRLAYNMKTIKVLASSLQEMGGHEKAEIIRVLRHAVERGGFTEMAVCNTKGVSYSSMGLSVDVSRRSYFQKAMAGETNVSQPLASQVTGEKTIVIAVPIDTEQGVTGVLFGVYPLSTAGEQLLDFTYYSEGYGFVVARDGTIVLSSDHADRLADEENFFAFLEKTTLTDFSVAALRGAMERGEAGRFSFTYRGANRFVSFMPSTLNDWYTFSIASDAPMLAQERATRHIVLMLVLKLAVVAVLLFAWVVLGHRRHNRELLQANQRYLSLLAHINGGMVVAIHAKTADETLITYVSDGFTDMTGYTLEDIQTIHQGRYLDVLYPEDRAGAFETYLRQLETGNTYHMPYRIRKKDGSLLWVIDNGYLVEDTGGLRNHSILTDITVIRQQEEALRLSENRFSVAINASSGSLFEVDLKHQVYTHFENPQRIFGTTAQQLLADTQPFSTLPHDEFVAAIVHYFFHPDDYAVSIQALNELTAHKIVSYEARLRQHDGNYIWCRADLSMSLDADGAPLRLVGFMADIDDIKKQAEMLERKVQTDPMTGLYNKIAMSTLANNALREYPNGHHALIVLDIDDFKGINDTLGHAFGDVVLIDVCTKLTALFRSSDIVGRMGGDEFAILMKNVLDTSGVLKKATELAGAFRQTYAGEKENYKISCSIGIIMIDHSDESFESLYRKADAALYRAKQNGKDQFVLYQAQDADNYPIECTRTNDEELQNLKASHNMESQIFELLYTSKDFSVSINMALATIGQQYHVSRVSVFENSEDGLTTSNIYEWCNEGTPARLTQLQNLPIRFDGESIFDCFDSNGLLYCSDVRELRPYLRRMLEDKRARSTLKVTIMNDEKVCGFIGFDDGNEYRIWTSEEIDNLSFLAKVLSVFLFKKKTEVALFENLHTRLKILDVLPDYICVVNPETHALVYANRKMQELLPEAHAGAFCFTTLRGGQTTPCKTCLVERIRRGDTDNLEIISEDGQLHLAINALSINWTKDQQMVLLYGTTQGPTRGPSQDATQGPSQDATQDATQGHAKDPIRD